MQGRITWRALIGLLAILCLTTPPEAPAAKKQTRMMEASAQNSSSGLFEKTEYVDRKQIDIGESYTYVSHSVSIITANPKEESEGRWSWTDGLIRGEGDRVQAVWIEVKAGNKSFWDDAVWVRVRLTVIVEENNGS